MNGCCRATNGSNSGFEEQEGLFPESAGDVRRPTRRDVATVARCAIAMAVMLVGVFGADAAFAQFTGDTDTPTEYVVTVNECEISTDGVTWVTLWDVPQAMDIASVGGGSSNTVGDFVTDLFIPPGDYDRVRCEIDDDFTITGSIFEGGTGATWFTVAGALDCSGLPGAPCAGSSADNSAPAESTTVTIPGGVITETIAIAPAITVTDVDSEDNSFQLDFDLTDAIELWIEPGGTHVILPAAPDISISKIVD